jgi:hypothetical protein
VGSKGSNTTTTNQSQTYNPAGASYITSALDRAASVANQPFNLPVAPVAGFSPQQQQAFNVVGQNYNAANPYFQQAGDYFKQSAAGPNVSQFFNPYASAVTDQLKDVFGQQMSQTTGKLTQAAGGIGADRIAVGQANLAKEQGLAAGQTLANLYQPALSAALQEQQVLQNAGYGTAAVGSGMQSNALQGAQALLGTGGLQQQLQQAQLNAPYQWEVQRAQFPYQQAQFLAGVTGSLAPGLGGTTSGQGTTTTPSPSLFSQILGLGTAGIGALGGSGAFGGSGWLTGSSPSYGGGNFFSGDAYGGSSANPLPGLTADDYGAGYARGGATSPYDLNFTKHPDGSWGYADGGSVDDDPGIAERIARYLHGGRNRGQRAFYNQTRAGLHNSATAPDEGYTYGGLGHGLNTRRALQSYEAQDIERAVRGYADGGEVPDEPINVLDNQLVPDVKLAAIQPNVPQLNLNPPQQSGGSGGGSGGGDIIGMAMKFLPMMLNTGGAVDMKKFDGFNPYSMHEHRFPKGYADGGAPDDDVINPDEPYRMADQAAVDEWRAGVARDMAAGRTYPQGGDDLPPVITEGTRAGPAAPQSQAMAFAPRAASPAAASPYSTPASPIAPTAPAATPAPEREQSFIDSPWAALMAAGLGIAGGTSPFALTNIGQGSLQGLKTLEQQRAAAQKQQTIDQSARRLEQEAKFHEDQYSRMTPYQREQSDLARRRQELLELQPVKVGVDMFGRDIYAKKDPKTGKYINIMTGKPVDEPTDNQPPNYRIPGAGADDESALPPNARPTSDTPTGVDLAFLSTLPPQMQTQVKAVSEGRRMLNPRSKEDQALIRLVGQYDPSFDLVNFNSRSKARQDFTSGKSAQNITSFNTAIGHLGSLDKAIDDLQNSDYPWWNKVANETAVQTGDTRFQKARAAFQNAKTAVTEELTRAFRGTGGNVHDIIEWDKSLSEASSPAALHSAVKTAIELLRSRIEAVGDQYNRGLGTTKDAMHLLSPKAQEAVKRLEGEAGPEKAAANPALDQARAAIAKGAPRDAVIKRLRENGIDPTGL